MVLLAQVNWLGREHNKMTFYAIVLKLSEKKGVKYGKDNYYNKGKGEAI